MSLTIEQFDDPLNPRGWAVEPVRRRIELQYPDADWRLRPVGMVESWDAYDGAEVPGGRSGMAAVCARLGETHPMPIDEYLWFDDPPTSSWPACRAVAAAAIQGAAPGRRLLRSLREATFLRRLSVDDDDVRASLIEAVPGLDAQRVAEALANGEADERFEAARSAAADLDVPGAARTAGRCELPAFVVRAAGEARAVSGLVDVEEFRATIDAVADVEPAAVTLDVEAALERYSPEGWIARAELSRLTGVEGAAAADEARRLVEGGDVVETAFAAEAFWRTAEYAPAAGDDEGDGGADGERGADAGGT
ncbi:MAG: DsbA family protein [Salinigranum sp.]